MAKGKLVLILAVAVTDISTASILVRLAGVHGFVAAWWRLALSSLLTLLLALATGALRDLGEYSRWEATVSIMGGVLLALHFGLWMLSLQYLNVAPSVTIVDSYPALLAITGRLLYGEEYSRGQLGGAVIAMAGVAGLAYYSGASGLSPPGGDAFYGALLSFGGMLAVAGYFMAGKYVRRARGTLSYTLVAYSSGALTETIMVWWVGASLTGYAASTYLYLALLALLPMLGGHTLVNYVLGRLSLLASTIPVLGEPVGASILAWLVLGEGVTLVEALLMAIVLLGIGLTLAYEGA
ncbi:MAG: DMT family transporter [Desulfurococcales archaeon]|nr:DMT family transporter [Desulfurococcales archaeon]